MLSSKELENMGKAIDEIGCSQDLHNVQIVAETQRKSCWRRDLMPQRLYAAQLTGTDENTELSRVLKICRKNNLSPRGHRRGSRQACCHRIR